ncbi:MAG TPA: methyltransferase domain-containing protein [Candidatus Dormibacteraeota bacterium]|nr:methyltransferase domain-containing protein [Candidatus Dormibacteraeota bacterium]
MTDPTLALRERMARELAERGLARSERWQRAFRRVPRHRFVPRFYEADGTMIDLETMENPEQGLARVYRADEPLVVGWDGRTGNATASSSAPAIMAAMLDRLELEPGHRVLEVGTGTGYGAALLAEVAGPDRVTTVDVDRRLVAEARARLDALGYRVTVECADGFGGWPTGAPYDRVIATCMAPRVPRAWVEQAPGGLIVAVVVQMMAVLRVGADGRAQGRFSHHTMWFMQDRRHAPAQVTETEARAAMAGGHRRRARVPLRQIMGGEIVPAFWDLFKLFHLPYSFEFAPAKGQVGIVARDDRSWVLLEDDEEGGWVTQGGRRRLWDEAEGLYLRLLEAGAPGRDRFGLTVRPDGGQVVWLDHPESGYRWEL